jgi:quinol monooxygenase YgiN
MKCIKKGLWPLAITTIPFTFFFCTIVMAQQKNQMVRMAKLVIDSAQLENYQAALKEQMETALRMEAGVLLYNAVYEKNNPTKITILEVYASDSAYMAHRQTPHFKKYKASTKDMVKSLELVDVVPIGLMSKLR